MTKTQHNNNLNQKQKQQRVPNDTKTTQTRHIVTKLEKTPKLGIDNTHNRQ